MRKNICAKALLNIAKIHLLTCQEAETKFRLLVPLVVFSQCLNILRRLTTFMSQSENRLLAALSTEEYQSLEPHLQLVELRQAQILYQPHEVMEYAYFLTQGIVSIVILLDNGSVVEAALLGNEGMVGLAVCWGGNMANHQAIMQISGLAMRIKATELKVEFDKGGMLQSQLLRFSQAIFTYSSQSTACNRLHTLEERLARWLLTVQDRVSSKELRLTQEFLSHMLGVRRSGVTVAANTLQQAGMIAYSRGQITIINRENLEATACECYRVVKEEYKRLLSIDKW